MPLHKYSQFLNERKIYDEDVNLQFSEKTRDPKYVILKELYDKANKKNFYALNKVDNVIFDEDKDRVTYLTGIIYFDTEEEYKSGKFKKNELNWVDVKDLKLDTNNLIYVIKKGKRDKSGNPILSNMKNWRKTNGGLHYFILPKDKNIFTIKTIGNSREISGKRIERVLCDLYSWIIPEKDPKIRIKIRDPKINLKIRENDPPKNDIVTIRKLLKTSINNIKKFELKPESLSKYDLIIKNEKLNRSKKIEVKKYGDTKVCSKKEDILIAEPFKISTDPGLQTVIDEYFLSINKKIKLSKEDNRDIKYNENFLIGKSKIEIRKQFSKLNKNKTIQNIRNFYNIRIDEIFKKVKDIKTYNKDSTNIVMKGIYGIYFFDGITGRNGFLIKNKDINYYWNIKEEWCGLNRIRLLGKIEGDSYKYVLIDNEHFVKTIKLKDKNDYKSWDKNYRKKLTNEELPVGKTGKKIKYNKFGIWSVI